MSPSLKATRISPAIFRGVFTAIIGLGILLRVTLFFQNRNLIIDEANIVRNLAARDFGGLILPLDYQQYAPPVFLWIEKGAAIIFGYGEQSMRLYALVCGIGALMVFYKVAARLMRKEAVWLPLALFAFGPVFVKYATEVKQYMPDTFIALLLVLAALHWDMQVMHRRKFVLLWIGAGSLAIWSSMPSVFILAGIGCYYAWPAARQKRWGDIGLLALIAMVWMAQFGLYYELILKQQIGSDYLQSYHRDYFLYALPQTKKEWHHNWDRIEDILGNVGGFSGVAVVTNIVLLTTGSVVLLKKRMQLFFLLALPIAFVLIAAMLHQFSLIDRVILFMMPLWMLLIGIGLETAWQARTAVRYIVLASCLYIVYAYNCFGYLVRKLGFHEITEGMAWIRARGGKGGQLYVHDASQPTYIYYTTLHPDRAQWRPLYGAHQLSWQDHYTSVTAGIRDTAYFLYTGGFPIAEQERRTKEIAQNMRQIAYFKAYICYVYVYVPKTQ